MPAWARQIDSTGGSASCATLRARLSLPDPSPSILWGCSPLPPPPHPHPTPAGPLSPAPPLYWPSSGHPAHASCAHGRCWRQTMRRWTSSWQSPAVLWWQRCRRGAPATLHASGWRADVPACLPACSNRTPAGPHSDHTQARKEPRSWCTPPAWSEAAVRAAAPHAGCPSRTSWRLHPPGARTCCRAQPRCWAASR